MNRKLPADKIRPRGVPGLAGASDPNMERALEIARDAHDAKVMRDLRAHLDDITKRPGAGNLNWKAALILLRAISDELKPATDKPIGKMDDGQFLVRSHPAIELLDELIDALSDLDRDVLHDALKTIRNASLSTSQRKRDGTETISSITFSSPDTGWEQFKQPRISGLAAAVATPEPSTWVLMMLGFAGLGYAASARPDRPRRSRDRSAASNKRPPEGRLLLFVRALDTRNLIAVYTFAGTSCRTSIAGLSSRSPT